MMSSVFVGAGFGVVTRLGVIIVVADVVAIESLSRSAEWNGAWGSHGEWASENEAV